MKKRMKIIIVLVLAIFLTVSTAYKKVEVFNKSELNNISCGWPMQYISSGFKVSRNDPPYPWKTNCINGEWGDPVDINWKYLIFDVAFFCLLILALNYTGNIIVKKMRRKKQDHSRG